MDSRKSALRRRVGNESSNVKTSATMNRDPSLCNLSSGIEELRYTSNNGCGEPNNIADVPSISENTTND